MAAKGSVAKVKVEERIREAFGTDYVGCFDKKLYVWADDGGERVQICISMTCPKTPVGEGTAVSQTKADVLQTQETFEVTPQEEKTIEDLMKKLGL